MDVTHVMMCTSYILLLYLCISCILRPGQYSVSYTLLYEVVLLFKVRSIESRHTIILLYVSSKYIDVHIIRV